MLPTKPILLDGLVVTEGKGKGANIYAPYLTWDEFIEFEFELRNESWYSHLPQVERVRKTERYFELLDKIDLHSVNDKVNARFETLKSLKKTKCKHAFHELGPREFTLTYSPKWFDDDKARLHMKTAIDRLIKYNGHVIKQFRAVGEFASQSHVHCFYELEGGLKIPDKHFKRAYPWWDTKVKTSRTGHQGGHHALVQDVGNFKSYIEKDIDDAWLDISHTEDPK